MCDLWQVEPDLVEALNRADSVAVGSRIRAARKAAAMTQPALADNDISVTYLSRIERGERRPGPDLLDRLCVRLGVPPEAIVRGFDTHGRRNVELQLEHAALALATNDAHTALRAAGQVIDEEAARQEPALLARAALIRADALASLGRIAEALTAYDDCLAAHPTSAYWPAAAIAASRLLRETGDLRRSAAVGESALERLASSPLNGTEEVIRLTVTHAASLYELGETDRARVLCEQAITAADALGSERAQAAAYWNSSVIESEAGNIDRALQLARHALSLLEGHGDSRNLATLRTQLAEILLRTVPAEVDAALTHLERAAQDYRSGNASEAQRLHNQVTLARARFMAGDSDGARGIASAVLEAVDDLPFVAASAATLLGQTSWALGDREDARRYYTAAIASLTSIGADRQAAQLWFDLANLLDEAGLTGQANDAYRRAAAASGYSARPNPFNAGAANTGSHAAHSGLTGPTTSS